MKEHGRHSAPNHKLLGQIGRRHHHEFWVQLGLSKGCLEKVTLERKIAGYELPNRRKKRKARPADGLFWNGKGGCTHNLNAKGVVERRRTT